LNEYAIITYNKMKKTILSFFILIFCVFGSFAQEAYWRFENNWSDEKGNHNGASVKSAGFSTSSVLEGSYNASFNNSTGNRMVTSNFVDLSSGAVTISLGILFYNSSGTGLILTNKQTTGGKGFAIIIDKTNKRIVVTTNNGTSEESAYSANNSLTQSSWNHVVVRFMDINGAYSKIFVNGVQSGTDSIGLSGSAQSQYLVMGAYLDDNLTLYEYIDNVQVYKAALTGTQITNLYNNRMNNYTVTTSTVGVTGVSVSPTTASIAIGGTTALIANVTPTNATNKSVSWSSSNTSVATVSSSGVVTGVAAGSVTITVTTVDGARTATCAVTVTTSIVPVTSVSVSPTTASITTGSTTTLTATVLPTNATNKNVTWATSNSAVATMSSAGIVTGVTAGSATITVTTVDQGKTATCAVTVSGTATGDNLGNHTATLNIKLNDKWLSNDGGNEGIRIDNSGNVGIGISAPSSWLGGKILEIYDNLPVLKLNSSGTTSTICFTNDDITATPYLGEFHLNYIFNSTDALKSYLSFYGYTGGNVLTLIANGKVGIGTANPTERLTVNGKILATEVEVVSSIASDYVLEPDYKLMPLADLERYLKQNKNLPGIPSAAEFSKEGQNLAKTDDLLLRKIEELTLYILQQNKIIYDMKTEIEKLKRK
jgi:uncharacterized protein YjdB